jgi:signal transduction histidine kinase
LKTEITGEVHPLPLESAFLAAMSHELKTPLTSILGFTDLLLQGNSGPLTEAQRRQLSSVEDSALKLLALVNDVLDLAKANAGMLELAREEFDLEYAIGACLKEVRADASEKGLGIKAGVEEGAKRAVGDMRRTEEALRHLLANALKFTDSGSVEVQARRRGEEVEVAVRDTGIGIAQEDLALLFKPFRQVDSGWARKYEGAGLGLSLVKGLIEAMGGRVRVESKKGEGSVFSFTLPAPRESPGKIKRGNKR